MAEDLIPHFGTNGRVTNIDRENENLRLDKVVYQDLNAKQEESYNFQKLSSVKKIKKKHIILMSMEPQMLLVQL